MRRRVDLRVQTNIGTVDVTARVTTPKGGWLTRDEVEDLLGDLTERLMVSLRDLRIIGSVRLQDVEVR